MSPFHPHPVPLNDASSKPERSKRGPGNPIPEVGSRWINKAAGPRAHRRRYPIVVDAVHYSDFKRRHEIFFHDAETGRKSSMLYENGFCRHSQIEAAPVAPPAAEIIPKIFDLGAEETNKLALLLLQVLDILTSARVPL